MSIGLSEYTNVTIDEQQKYSEIESFNQNCYVTSPGLPIHFFFLLPQFSQKSPPPLTNLQRRKNKLFLRGKKTQGELFFKEAKKKYLDNSNSARQLAAKFPGFEKLISCSKTCKSYLLYFFSIFALLICWIIIASSILESEISKSELTFQL